MSLGIGKVSKLFFISNADEFNKKVEATAFSLLYIIYTGIRKVLSSFFFFTHLQAYLHMVPEESRKSISCDRYVSGCGYDTLINNTLPIAS